MEDTILPHCCLKTTRKQISVVVIALFLEKGELTSIHPDRILITVQRNYPIQAQFYKPKFIGLTYNIIGAWVKLYNTSKNSTTKKVPPKIGNE